MRRALLALVLAALAALAPASPAQAVFGLDEFDVTFTGPEAETVTQAGAHPFAMKTSLSFITGAEEKLEEAPKDILLTQVKGFVGNPSATPRCTTADFLTRVLVGLLNVPNCPDGSAVGIASVTLAASGEAAPPAFGAVYNLEPPPGVAAKLGFWIANVPVTLEAEVSPTPPYNIIAGPTNISQVLEVVASTFELWGTPADPAHDPLRGHCLDFGSGGSNGICPAAVPEVPFITLPRACEGPLKTLFRVDSWQNPGAFQEGFSETHDEAGNPTGMSGCGKLGFNPEVGVLPSTASAESASGLEIAIDVADEGMLNPAGFAQADIEATELRFPAGMTLNPSAAEGLGVCTPAQFARASLTEQGCPDASKLGSLEVDTPILENHTLQGAFYLAQQDDPGTLAPGAENPFDSLFAAYLVITDPTFGVFVKLASKIETDEATGQVIARAEDLPPFPLSRVKIHLDSGPRAPLITPPSCGTYTTTAILTPSSGAAPLETTSSFLITSGPGGSPCPAGGIPPFEPGFDASATNATASAYSPFAMRLTRSDGQQDLTRFSAALPRGVVPTLKGLTECPDQAIEAAKAKTGRSELASPSCPASSAVGRVLAGGGVGSALTYVPGSLYLAGPYKGTQLSVVAIVPAVAGPFDVGTVVTRVGLRLNPVTYEGEVDGAASDPIPHILKGIPLKVRDIRVFADRPNFTQNATSCKEMATTAQIFGSFADPFNPADDVPVARTARYQASSCASLAFKPKLALKLKGGTKRGDHPSLRATVTYPYPSGPGYANVGKAVVILPPSEFIDNAHINNPCTRVQFNENKCPPSSILGTAKAITPLLDQPLEGKVYFRSNGGERPLPDVVIDLGGQFRAVLVGAVDTATPKTNPRIRTSFRLVPDAPVKKFTVNLFGGKKGLLVNNRNLCARKLRAEIKLTGQNGRAHNTRPVVQAACGGKRAGRGR